MYGLDGEEIWYADFKHGKGVKPQPSFVDPIDFPGTYEGAVTNQQICRNNLKTDLEAYKGFQPEKGKDTSYLLYFVYTYILVYLYIHVLFYCVIKVF